MVIIQDKYGLRCVRWGETLPRGMKLEDRIVKKKTVLAILNCMIYLEMMDREIKDIYSVDHGIESYWEVTRERITALREALKRALKNKKVV